MATMAVTGGGKPTMLHFNTLAGTWVYPSTFRKAADIDWLYQMVFILEINI